MKSLDIRPNEAYLICDDKTRYYFTGLKSSAGFLLLTETKKTLFIDHRYFSHAKEFLAGKVKVDLFESLDGVFSAIKALAIKKIYVDFSIVTVAEYEKFKAYGIPVSDGSKALTELKSVKTEEEIENIRVACDLAYAAFEKTYPKIRVGMTEKQVALLLEDNMRAVGAEGVSFETIVAFGKNAAVPHHEPDDTPLNKDECILMDFGCLYKGYCSDITRMLFMGKPSEEFLTAYDAVLTANVLAEEKIAEGCTGKEADAIARTYLDEKGYGKVFTHSLGHSVGLNIHEAPTLSPKCETPLTENMVFTVEPGVYLDGKFGIRIEDTVYMKNGKVERLFSDDKKLILL